MKTKKSFWEQLHYDYNGYCYYNWDDDTQTKLKDMPFILFAIRHIFILLRQRHCHHKWEVESHISPDSGSEDFTCTKCGISHHVIYY